jgi:glucosamine--fructose-6-phosphate aminotransferase (isomerizing)
MPVVAIALDDGTRDKMLSNIEQVRARDGLVIGILTEGDDEIASKCHDVIFLPRTTPLLYPLLSAIPMQLLSYHIAVRRGCDVDQPRNLAKTVTVE